MTWQGSRHPQRSTYPPPPPPYRCVCTDMGSRPPTGPPGCRRGHLVLVSLVLVSLVLVRLVLGVGGVLLALPGVLVLGLVGHLLVVDLVVVDLVFVLAVGLVLGRLLDALILASAARRN
jgi:hypothetical protein